MIHQDIREWVAKFLRLDLSTASPERSGQAGRRDRALAEAHYVRKLLSLAEYRPLVG